MPYPLAGPSFSFTSKIGSVTARAMTARPGDERHYLYPGKRLIDSRVYMHFYAIAYLDKDGKALDGSKTCKINLPANVPAKDF